MGKGVNVWELQEERERERKRAVEAIARKKGWLWSFAGPQSNATRSPRQAGS